MNTSRKEGLPFLGAIPGSPVEKAGIRTGDMIIGINGMVVNTIEDYVNATASRQNPMIVDVKRGLNQYLEFKVYLPETPVIANPAAIVAQLQEANILPQSVETKEDT